MVSEERRAEVEDLAEKAAVERIIDVLNPETASRSPQSNSNPFTATLGSIFGNNHPQPPAPQQPQQAPPSDAQQIRDQVRGEIERGFYDVRLIEIEIEETPSLSLGMMPGMDQGGGADFGEMLGGLMPKRRAKKRVTVAEARRIFVQEEANKLIGITGCRQARSVATRGRGRHHLH